MGKKSGFFYSMLAMMGLYMYYSTQYQPSASTGGGGGTGKKITSYGKKPAYMKDKVLYQDRGDIIWTPTGSYWRTRALAEANR